MADYKKQLIRAKARTGLVITAGLLVLFFAVLFAGNLGNLVSPHVTVYAIFDDVKGLQKGAPVWFSGVQIGSVESIEFVQEAKIRVPLSIKRDVLPYIKQDSPATILTLGLLGDKYVEIGPGGPSAPSVGPGGQISGRSQPAGDIAGLIAKIQTKKSTIGRLVEEDTLYRDVSDSVKDIKTFAAAIKNSEGSLGKFINDPALYEKFLKASQSLDRFSKKLTASKGTVNSLLEDESLYINLNAAVLKLNSLLDSVNSGQGTVGRLLRDRELSEDLQKTLKDVNGLVKDVKENPKKYFSFSLF